MSHKPIEEKHFHAMNVVAEKLQAIFEPHGFVLLVFENNSPSGRMNYISNSNRNDVVVAMKEFIANHEGRMMETPKGKQ